MEMPHGANGDALQGEPIPDISTDNKPNNSPSCDEQDNPLKELLKNFNMIWETYPVKKGKQKAETHFLSWIKGRKINGRTLKMTDREMWYAVQTYLKEIEENKTDLQFVPHGSTFFNNKIYDYYEIWKENETNG